MSGNGEPEQIEASRPSVAAMAVGVGRAAVEFAAEYAATRVQFGKPIGQNQGVAFQLADMAAAVDAARAFKLLEEEKLYA